MGRLFWKFFFSILLAQVAATIAIGGAFWLKDQAETHPATPAIDTSASAAFLIESAAATLEYGGSAALRRLLATAPRHRIYVVDETGRDLLDRAVGVGLLDQAGQALSQDGKHPVVRRQKAADGHQYLIFLPSTGDPRGPGGLREPGGPFDPGASRDPGQPRGADGAGAADVQPQPGAPHDAGAPQGLDTPHGTGPARTLASAGASMPGSAWMRGGPPPDFPRGEGAHFGPAGPDDSSAGDRFGPGGERFGPGGDAERHGPPPPDRRFHPFIPIAAAMLASLLFAALLAWHFSRPIRALRLAFEAAAAGDLAPRFGGPAGARGDELSDLGRDFDRMAAQLRTLMDGQKRLLHDVSHELRSPLARMQAAIGLAHQQPEKSATFLDRIERESVRMDRLVGELLTLARLEAGAVLKMEEDISVADLIENIVADARFEAAADEREVKLLGQADVRVAGVADLLCSAVENVVRNAVKHSFAGGTVEVAMEVLAPGQQCRIRVLDRGPGIPEADLPAIFQPFFRSVANQGQTSGHGLGLAIAQRVIHAHGGQIVAANRGGGGLCVDITLPIAPAR